MRTRKRNPDLTRTAILVLSALAIVLIGRDLWRPAVLGDGIGYYAPLASAIFDHDLNLQNEYAHASPSVRSHWLTLPDGRLVDPYPIGVAFFWAPVIASATLTDPARANYGQPGRWRNSSPGFDKRYFNALAIGTLLQALAGAAILYRCLRPHFGRPAAALGVAGATVGTPFLYYTFGMPSYAHVASFLACAALLAAALSRSTSRRSLVLLGALWGLVALVRYQDAVLGILAAPKLWRDVVRGNRSWRERIARTCAFAVPALLVFLPQMLFWQRIYGQPLVFAVPSGFMHWWNPQVLPFLFSTWQGAILWSPVVLLGIAGLFAVPDRALRAATLAAVALEIYASAAAGDWWGSASCGARRLVVVGPVLALGVAALFAFTTGRGGRAPLALATAVLLCIVWNWRLTQFYARDYLPRNPANAVDYMRDFPPEHPYRRVWGQWEYARWFEEVGNAERRMWR